MENTIVIIPNPFQDFQKTFENYKIFVPVEVQSLSQQYTANRQVPTYLLNMICFHSLIFE